MTPTPEPSGVPGPDSEPRPDGALDPEPHGAPDPGPRPVPVGRRIPWTARLAALLLEVPAVLSAAFGLMILVLSLTGGGVSLGSAPTRPPGLDPDSSPVLGLLLGLGILGLAGAIMALSVGVRRGRLIPSLIAASLGVVLLVGGVREMGSGDPQGGGVVRDLLLPGALIALLVSRPNRAYVAARQTERRGAVRIPGPGPTPADDVGRRPAGPAPEGPRPVVDGVDVARERR